MAKFFFDTDILISMFDLRDPRKQGKALAKVRFCIENGNGVVSTQVLQEFAGFALTRLRQSRETVLRELTIFQSLEVVPLTLDLIRTGVELSRDRQLPFWHATIFAAAKQADCEVLYSEGLPGGTSYGKVRVENPLQ